MTRQLARRRRRERLAGSALALIGVAVLVVAVIALQHPSTTAAGASAPRAATGAPATSRSPAPSTASQSVDATSTQRASPAATGSAAPSGTARLPLVVLNNTTIRGLAEQASARFTAGGWTVTSYGNYQNDILSTCAYFDPSIAAAQSSAEALQAQYPTIKRVVAKFAGLPAGPIVVVLTPDYSAN